MGLNTNQQIFELVKKSSNILITFKLNHKGDSIGSALGLYKFLQKMDKKVTVVSDNFSIPANMNFLEQIKDIHPKIKNLAQFIISLNTANTKVEEFSYDVEGDHTLHIFVTPQDGMFSDNDVKARTSGYRYDLIITLDTPDLESLGKIYEENTDFFYNTPIINIDHSSENEQFGQINMVDLTASSTSELVFDLIEEYDIKVINEELATSLLTGIFTATDSFKSPYITPKTLNIASKLILAGAQRDVIVKNLYYTHSVPRLKLWGKILARLKNDQQYKMVWSPVSWQDFVSTSTSPKDLLGVVDELISTTPEAEIIILIYELENNNVCALVHSPKNIEATLLVKEFDPEGSKNYAKINIKGKSLIEAEKEIIETVRKNLEKLNR